MEKPILYCDCDGVLLNTIEIAFQIMRDVGYNVTNRRDVDLFFKRKIDWNEVFDKATFINNSIEKLKYIKEKNIFKDVIILTKLSGGYDEERLKRSLFYEALPNIRVITLQYGLIKGLVVNAKNNILVDDEIGNCKSWEENGGTAILFSPYMRNLEDNIINDLFDIKNTSSVKKMLKTRYF